MRKPASCVLSIALSIVMSAGLIPSPAFAEIDSTSEPATQSANKPNDNQAETTSDQTQPNEPNDAVSNPSSETPNQTPECSPSDINATSGASPSNKSASDDSATALQSDTDSASNDTPRVDWRKEKPLQMDDHGRRHPCSTHRRAFRFKPKIRVLEGIS